MIPADMRPGMRYVVTRGSDDGTFVAGDHIWMLSDGDIMCKEAAGWQEAADLPEVTLGMLVEVDAAWVERHRSRLQAELAAIEAGKAKEEK